MEIQKMWIVTHRACDGTTADAYELEDDAWAQVAEFLGHEIHQEDRATGRIVDAGGGVWTGSKG